MEDLLKAILNGVGTPPDSRSAGSGDPMMDILGGILGGGTAPSAPAGRGGGGSSSGNIIGDVLGDLMSGGDAQNSSPMAGLLEMVLGGMGGGSGQSANNPLVKLLVDKVGLPPIIAQMAVSYFMAKMLSGKQGGGGLGGGLLEGLVGGGFKPGTAQKSTFDLDHLLGNADDDEALAGNLLQSGMPQELAQHAGIDQDTAIKTLQEMVKMMSQQNAVPKPVTTRQADLKGLLDNWETD